MERAGSVNLGEVPGRQVGDSRGKARKKLEALEHAGGL